MKIIPHIIGHDQAGQRVDNFLIKHMKGLPKSRLYRAFRTGEVRVNHSRVKPSYRLQLGDQVRIPPLRLSTREKPDVPHHWSQELTMRILYEDHELMVIDKPAGIPVHGGTGLAGGIIDVLREKYPNQKFIELIHRLDKETSGCLLIAKKRSSLLYWQQLLEKRHAVKQYLTLVRGNWGLGNYCVNAPLQKNILRSGERMVVVSDQGKVAATRFRPLRFFKNATLMEAQPLTGRTHQIRVHAAFMGHPIAGDQKYGDRLFNQEMRKLGLERLFLHAGSIGVDDSGLQSCQVVEPTTQHSPSRHKAQNQHLKIERFTELISPKRLSTMDASFSAIGVMLADDLRQVLSRMSELHTS